MSDHEPESGAPSRRLHDYLIERGLPPAVCRRGLPGLVSGWAAVACDAARYDLTLDDWRNDLDLRDIIAGAFELAPEDERIATRDALEGADLLFRDGTVDAGRPLWGSTEHHADAAEVARQWWYRRYPAHPGHTMREDLVAAGVMR